MNDSWNRRQLRKLIERVGRLERVQDTDREVVRLGEDWHLEDGALYIYDDDGNLRTRVGKQYDGTYTSRDRNGPIPPTPFVPEVRRRVNGVVVIWDGTFANPDDAPPQDFRYIAVHASKDSAFVPSFETERATIVSEDGGQAFVALPAGDQWHIALQTVTTSYRRSDKSDQVRVTPRASYIEFEANDAYTVTAADVTAGTATMQLSHVPLRESLVGFWGGVPQPPTEYVIDYAAGTVAWTLSGIVQAGDRLWVHYAYDAATALEPPPILDLNNPGFVFVSADNTSFDGTGISSDGRGDTDLTTAGIVQYETGGFLGHVFGGNHATPGVPPWEPGMRFFLLGEFGWEHARSYKAPPPYDWWVDGIQYGAAEAALYYSGTQLRTVNAPAGAPVVYKPTGGGIDPLVKDALEVWSPPDANGDPTDLGQNAVVGQSVNEAQVSLQAWAVGDPEGSVEPGAVVAKRYTIWFYGYVLWYPSLAAGA